MNDPAMRFAIPNKGRLEAPTAQLLQQAGFRYERTERSLAVPVLDRNIELLFVRADDICELVTDGVADLGITGLDLVAESGADIEVLAELGYGHCRLAAAVPNASPVESIADFEGLRVATSHPNTAAAFFAGKGVTVRTIPLRGSVEVAPKLDIADAVVDLISSGSTMRLNGLRPVIDLLASQAALVRPQDATRITEVDEAVTMITSVVAARRKKYVLMNAPVNAVGEIRSLIPGFDAPSIVPLADPTMVAIHSVVDAGAIWDVIPRLKAAGASGILVLPIEQLLL
jgi:ATP phosphoribosyltransferase